MKKSFLIIGLGRFGIGIVRTLAELKCDLIAIDRDEVVVSKAAEIITHCAICDSTKLSSLKEIGAKNIDHAVVAIGGNLQSTILTVINLKELGIPRITVRVDEDEYISVMERLGATEVIIPEEESAVSLATHIVSDGILDYYKVSKEYGVIQMKVNERFEEMDLIKLDSRNRFDVNIIGIMRGEEFSIPRGTDIVKPGDVLMVMGKDTNLIKFENIMNKKPAN